MCNLPHIQGVHFCCLFNLYPLDQTRNCVRMCVTWFWSCCSVMPISALSFLPCLPRTKFALSWEQSQPQPWRWCRECPATICPWKLPQLHLLCHLVFPGRLVRRIMMTSNQMKLIPLSPTRKNLPNRSRQNPSCQCLVGNNVYCASCSILHVFCFNVIPYASHLRAPCLSSWCLICTISVPSCNLGLVQLQTCLASQQRSWWSLRILKARTISAIWFPKRLGEYQIRGRVSPRWALHLLCLMFRISCRMFLGFSFLAVSAVYVCVCTCACHSASIMLSASCVFSQASKYVEAYKKHSKVAQNLTLAGNSMCIFQECLLVIPVYAFCVCVCVTAVL